MSTSANEKIIITLKIWIVNAVLATLIIMCLQNPGSIIHEPLLVIKSAIFMLSRSFLLIPVLYLALGKINKQHFSRVQKTAAFMFVAIMSMLIVPLIQMIHPAQSKIRLGNFIQVIIAPALPYIFSAVISSYIFSRNYFHSLRVSE